MRTGAGWIFRPCCHGSKPAAGADAASRRVTSAAIHYIFRICNELELIMIKNVGGIDRILRIVVGLALILWFFV
ncbi:MAG: DUF2892 domain-containing protein, partial [Gemmobacter sp.]